MKKVPAQVWSALSAILINLAGLLIFVYFLHGYVIYNGLGGFIINPTWFGFDIDFMTFLNGYFYGSLGLFFILNIIWVCVIPYVVSYNAKSVHGWYCVGFVINIILGLLASPLLVWFPYGLDIFAFLILLGLSLLVSVGAFMISSLFVDENYRGWWRLIIKKN